MKTTKKSQPTARKIGRPPRPEDAVERQMVGTRLSPSLYEQLVAAAASNGRSISAEMEKRVEQSFETEPAKPGNDLMRRMVDAFEARWMDDRPAEQWMKDGVAYDGSVIRVFEVLLARHPDPGVEHFTILLHAIRSRLEGRLLAVDPDGDRGLPGLDWGKRHRIPKPDTAEERKDED
jgi:hypothetical protein